MFPPINSNKIIQAYNDYDNTAINFIKDFNENKDKNELITKYNIHQNKEHKIEMYQSNKSINFEYLTYEDDDRLYDKLKEICNKYKIPLK